MIKKSKQRLTLDRPARYQIKVLGALDERWLAGNGELKFIPESGEEDLSITTLTGTFDQAALHGLLRRVYTLGLPLISVRWIEADYSR